ncbi:MAG: thymidine phosphorylase [Chloroflexi bacterium]|nr:thymidine phosphorylase [Chloroflexota bacterium]
MPELLDRKRWGGRLTRDELEQLVGGYVRGSVPDYQVAAWLMAVCCQGMDRQELADLTALMAGSGRQLDLSGIGRPVVDKHSTGGVGDKLSLIVAPLVAALGVGVAKLSGRGLGFTGGTLDKLESFSGLIVEIDPERFMQQIGSVGAAIAGQSPDLAPADGKLYALRDVTGTVGSIPLIASSVMSKKLAGGAPAIVLDVKQGRGAFMTDLDGARQLAAEMMTIGRLADRRVTAFVTDMDRPLGRCVGNALEVREAIEVLGGQPSDGRLVELATTVAGEMLLLGGAVASAEEGRRRAEAGLSDGVGLAKLAEIVEAQRGDAAPVGDPNLLPAAPVILDVVAPHAGFIADLEPMAVALTANRLGAGRARKGDPVDHAVGLEVLRTTGDAVEAGEVLARVHARTEGAGAEAVATVLAAYRLGDEAPALRPIVLDRISTEG